MNDQQLAQLLEQAAQQLGVVGAQLAIFDGTAQREFATGLRNREQALPVTTNTLFQIGSTTKLFNAALVMTLVDAGKLGLDVPVYEYLPDLRLSDLDAQCSITLRQLLSMTAGLDNGSYHDYGRGDDALGRYVDALAGVTQMFTPGSAYGYSNAGTNVAGHIAARVCGRSWEQLLNDRVLTPLGMTRSALFSEDLLAHEYALGYTWGPGQRALQRVTKSLPRSCGPAGATLCCSAGELVRFARMFLDEGRNLAGQQILSPAAVRTMHTPQVTLPTENTAHKWGVGPYWKQWDGCTIHGHSGTNLSGSSMLLWCPERKVAIATAVNVPNIGYPFAEAIFDVVFPEMFGIDKPKPLSADTARPQRVDLEPFAGRFEAWGAVIHFSIDNGCLIATTDNQAARGLGLESRIVSELVPIGGARFLPSNPALAGNRAFDVAFWGDDGRGRPSHYLNGVFALRRTG